MKRIVKVLLIMQIVLVCVVVAWGWGLLLEPQPRISMPTVSRLRGLRSPLM